MQSSGSLESIVVGLCIYTYANLVLLKFNLAIKLRKNFAAIYLQAFFILLSFNTASCEEEFLNRTVTNRTEAENTVLVNFATAMFCFPFFYFVDACIKHSL